MKISSDEIISTYRFCGGGQDCAADCEYHYLRDVNEHGPYWSGSCEACTGALESDYINVCEMQTYFGKCKTCKFFIPHMISVKNGECYFKNIFNGEIDWSKETIEKKGTQTCKNYEPYYWGCLEEYN